MSRIPFLAITIVAISILMSCNAKISEEPSLVGRIVDKDGEEYL
jgi:hypothetical protein